MGIGVGMLGGSPVGIGTILVITAVGVILGNPSESPNTEVAVGVTVAVIVT